MIVANHNITPAQKVIIDDFHVNFTKIVEKYWVPSTDDSYWDAVTDDAMALLTKFHTNDRSINVFFENTVAAFLNSREDLSA